MKSRIYDQWAHQDPYQPLDRAWPSCRFWVCYSVDRTVFCHLISPHAIVISNPAQHQVAASLAVKSIPIFPISEDARCRRRKCSKLIDSMPAWSTGKEPWNSVFAPRGHRLLCHSSIKKSVSSTTVFHVFCEQPTFNANALSLYGPCLK